jgi:plasmid stabilization system protein ParE
MNSRYVLAPQAALDLAEIWQYLNEQSSASLADRVESVTKDKFVFLAWPPRAGHRRDDLTIENVRFFLAYSDLVVYRPETRPHQPSLIAGLIPLLADAGWPGLRTAGLAATSRWQLATGCGL